MSRSFLHLIRFVAHSFLTLYAVLLLITSRVQFSEIQLFIYENCVSYPVNVQPKFPAPTIGLPLRALGTLTTGRQFFHENLA